MWLAIQWQFHIVVIHESISHLKHLVNKSTYLLISGVGDSDKYVGTRQTQSKKFAIVKWLLVIESRYGVKNLCETEICQLLGLSIKVVVADKDLIIAVDKGDAIGQSLLLLRSEIPDDIHVDWTLQKFALIGSPLVDFHQLHDTFYEFKVVCLGVRRHNNQEA